MLIRLAVFEAATLFQSSVHPLMFTTKKQAAARWWYGPQLELLQKASWETCERSSWVYGFMLPPTEDCSRMIRKSDTPQAFWQGVYVIWYVLDIMLNLPKSAMSVSGCKSAEKEHESRENEGDVLEFSRRSTSSVATICHFTVGLCRHSLLEKHWRARKTPQYSNRSMAVQKLFEKKWGWGHDLPTTHTFFPQMWEVMSCDWQAEETDCSTWLDSTRWSKF